MRLVREAREKGAALETDRDPGGTRAFEQVAQRRIVLALVPHVQAAHGVAGRQRLVDRVDSVDDVVEIDPRRPVYAAVRCYAPAQINSCGGEDVPQAQRKAWFQQLKKRYPNSRWAKELQNYW